MPPTRPSRGRSRARPSPTSSPSRRRPRRRTARAATRSPSTAPAWARRAGSRRSAAGSARSWAGHDLGRLRHRTLDREHGAALRVARAQGLETAEEAARLRVGDVPALLVQLADAVDQPGEALAHPRLVLLLDVLRDRPLLDVERGVGLPPAEERELDRLHRPVLGQVVALVDREVVDAELQALGRLGCAVRTAGLVVGDPRPALRHRADPVDLAADPGPLELEREPALGRGGRRLPVAFEPVADQDRLGVGALGLGDGVRGEARLVPPLVERAFERLGSAIDRPDLAILDDLVHGLADPGLVAPAGIQAEL